MCSLQAVQVGCAECGSDLCRRAVEHFKGVRDGPQPGTGKSFLLRVAIRVLFEMHHGNVGVTAPTGVAATHIGGCTLHHLLGCGIPRLMSA